MTPKEFRELISEIERAEGVEAPDSVWLRHSQTGEVFRAVFADESDETLGVHRTVLTNEPNTWVDIDGASLPSFSDVPVGSVIYHFTESYPIVMLALRSNGEAVLSDIREIGVDEAAAWEREFAA